MENSILGLHHITAIANNAQRTYDFYTKVLGLRLVKKTVNFDDPGTYHLYFGDQTGTPGTILTFFPWEGIGTGRSGTGMATGIGFSVPAGSHEFWMDRFRQNKVNYGESIERGGEAILPFEDPDGLQLELVVSKDMDQRIPWVTEEVAADKAIRGFHVVTLSLKRMEPTAKILTEVMGYQLTHQEGNRHFFMTNAVDSAARVDLVALPEGSAGINAAGTNHHVAFRVKDEASQMAFREKIVGRRLSITPKIDRDYFYSMYFREPGGVLFELATDNPGFTIDEPVEALGSGLKLPGQYEGSRQEIEKGLPKLI